jgi:hypothetical protein
MVLTSHGNAAPLLPALDRDARAERVACHGDPDPCTLACTSCIVCGRDAGRAELLCPTCRADVSDA